MSNTARPSTPAAWNPACNAVDRLVQVLDVLAINLHRFRARSSRYSPDADGRRTPRSKNARLRLLRRLYDRQLRRTLVAVAGEYDASQAMYTLVAGATTEFTRLGAPEFCEAAMRAGELVGLLGGIWQPQADPVYPPDPKSEVFDAQGELLGRYPAVRHALMGALVVCGRPAPPAVFGRWRLAVYHVGHPLWKSLSGAGLRALVDELAARTAERAVEPGAASGRPPEPPAVAEAAMATPVVVADDAALEQSATAPDAAIAAPPDAAAGTRPTPDGPDGPGDGFNFRYGNFASEFTKAERRYHRLLVLMWPKYGTMGMALCCDLAERWSADGKSAPDDKVMGNYCGPLSTILRDRFGVPAKLVKDGEYIRWKAV